MWKKLNISFVVALLLSLSSYAISAPIDSFNDYVDTICQTESVFRWDQDIVYYIKSDNLDYASVVKGELERTCKELKVNCRPLRNGERPNFIVLLTKDAYSYKDNMLIRSAFCLNKSDDDFYKFLDFINSGMTGRHTGKVIENSMNVFLWFGRPYGDQDLLNAYLKQIVFYGLHSCQCGYGCGEYPFDFVGTNKENEYQARFINKLYLEQEYCPVSITKMYQ